MISAQHNYSNPKARLHSFLGMNLIRTGHGPHQINEIELVKKRIHISLATFLLHFMYTFLQRSSPLYQSFFSAKLKYVFVWCFFLKRSSILMSNHNIFVDRRTLRYKVCSIPEFLVPVWPSYTTGICLCLSANGTARSCRLVYCLFHKPTIRVSGYPLPRYKLVSFKGRGIKKMNRTYIMSPTTII